MVNSDFVQQFNENGYAVIPNFLSDEEIVEMKKTMARIVDEMDPKEHSSHIFHLDDKTCKSRDEYFLTSNDKIRFFFEPKAVDQDGNLTVPKSRSVNKIGHALAWLEPVFKKITFGEKVKDVCRQLGHKDPRVVQSMYIFKNPVIGQKVSTHQDSTFLYTDPPSNLLGFWFALDDAAVENGCLYFLPGTQNVNPTSRFVRTPNPGTTGDLTMIRGVEPDYPLDQFKPAPVSKGSLVLIHGNVIHRSEDNTSDLPRHAYTFHVVDHHNAQYSKENWLQPSEALPFPKLYDVKV
ncbi:phytanoyl-CoA dioxygenase domain-containing protein 1 homolog [Paramacrobiotus metropolitanus]|uniref:phytanoyl-CoA dioxygenase domain-containing protein 1 homolog n=1 Tax=Paramacrobiotus metropolitanus TaxID=2943436 RepID=UPI002445BF11|nr:phytanoyl-CoA dioxygenase domain-containing protein 1 homolog [Paramacrobiotus metropolitanus]